MKFPTLATIAAGALLLVSTEVQAVEKTLNIVSYNVFFFSEALSNWGQRTRAELISKARFMKNQDIVLLQECFDSDAREILINGLKSEYPHYTNVIGQSRSGWDRSSGDFSETVFENGGVMIMSKWPILYKQQHVYSKGCGAENFANKGFLYVKLDVFGSNVHVFNTHTQSTDSGCRGLTPRQIRETQLTELRDHMRLHKIPANELVILGGDFNVIRGTDEYHAMLKLLDAKAPDEYLGHRYTWDANNEINKYEHPNAASEYLDYIFTHARHAKAKTSLTATMPTTPQPYKIGNDEWNEYSDHYPVFMTLTADI